MDGKEEDREGDHSEYFQAMQQQRAQYLAQTSWYFFTRNKDWTKNPWH